jgi:hypothetical protein
MQDCSFSFLLIVHPLMTLQAWPRASLVFRRELWLPCNTLFGAPPNKEQPIIDHAANLVDHLHDIYNYSHQHLKLGTDQMKTHYDRLATSAGYHEGEEHWHERKVTQASIPMEGPIQGSHADKRCGVQDPAEP